MRDTWTVREAEGALDDEAVRMECSMLGDDSADVRDGIAVISGRLRDMEQWFQEVVESQIDEGKFDELEAAYDEPPEDLLEDVEVNVQVVAGPGGYLPAGSPAYKRSSGDIVLAESAYEGESEVYLPTDDEEFMETAVKGRLIDEDEETVMWMHHVMWTAFLPADEEDDE